MVFFTNLSVTLFINNYLFMHLSNQLYHNDDCWNRLCPQITWTWDNRGPLLCSSLQFEKGQTKAGILTPAAWLTGYAGLPRACSGWGSNQAYRHWRRQSPICCSQILRQTGRQLWDIFLTISHLPYQKHPCRHCQGADSPSEQENSSLV